MNDSSGTGWVKLENLTKENASPLVLKLLEEQRQDPNSLDKTTYLDWNVRSSFNTDK